MDTWKTVIFLACLWSVGIIVSLRKESYPTEGTLFHHQRWGVWAGLFAATLLELMTVFVLWSPWSFRGRPTLVIFYMFAEIAVFTGVLLFYRGIIRQPYRLLGLSMDDLAIRMVFGLRWIAGVFWVGYAAVYTLLSFQTAAVSNDWLLRLSRHKGVVFVLLNFFEKTWGLQSLWMPVLFMVVFKPLVEEVVFRGLLYGPIRKKTDPVMATLMTSFLFMLADGSYRGHHLLSGILLAYLYERTGSLLPGILFQGLTNLGSVLYFLDRRKINTLDIANRRDEAGSIALLLLAAFLLVEFLYRYLLKKGYAWKIPGSASFQ